MYLKQNYRYLYYFLNICNNILINSSLYHSNMLIKNIFTNIKL